MWWFFNQSRVSKVCYARSNGVLPIIIILADVIGNCWLRRGVRYYSQRIGSSNSLCRAHNTYLKLSVIYYYYMYYLECYTLMVHLSVHREQKDPLRYTKVQSWQKDDPTPFSHTLILQWEIWHRLQLYQVQEEGPVGISSGLVIGTLQTYMCFS